MITKQSIKDWLSGIIRYDIEKRWQIGRLKIKFEKRSSQNLWGRFGGGWNWKVGFQAGGRTVIFDLLVCSVRLSLEEKTQ